MFFSFHSCLSVATVLTACGIETGYVCRNSGVSFSEVATVLTACGIETEYLLEHCFGDKDSLQQYLPLAVLKHSTSAFSEILPVLQQYLPLAVLKQTII